LKNAKNTNKQHWVLRKLLMLTFLKFTEQSYKDIITNMSFLIYLFDTFVKSSLSNENFCCTHYL